MSRLAPTAPSLTEPQAVPYDRDEWCTPSWLIELAREVLGVIDLDPASTAEANKVVCATRYFTKRDDGLAQVWSGRIWLNPPYSQPLCTKFVEKLLHSYERSITTFAAANGLPRVEAALLLVNATTDTKFFQQVLAQYHACFLRGRVAFTHPQHPSSQNRNGQTLFYLGRETDRFAQVFTPYGTVVKALKGGL